MPRIKQRANKRFSCYEAPSPRQSPTRLARRKMRMKGEAVDSPYPSPLMPTAREMYAERPRSGPRIRPRSAKPRLVSSCGSPVAEVKRNGYQAAAVATGALELEAMQVQLRSLKQELHSSASEYQQVSAHNARLKKQVATQQKQLETVLERAALMEAGMDPMIGAGSAARGLCDAPPRRNHHMVAEFRKELEKTVMVRWLKEKLTIVQATVAERDGQLQALNRSQRGLALAEMASAKEEFHAEVLRLRQELLRKDKLLRL
ncbi:unnamed protein product [Chrysoparadoxa australica]